MVCQAVGKPSDVSRKRWENDILACLPGGPPGWDVTEITDRAFDDGNVPASRTVRRIMDGLLMSDKVMRSGDGKRANAYRYWIKRMTDNG